MKKFNLPVRLKNPITWVQIIGAFILSALAYNQMTPQDLTTWVGVADMLKGVLLNPYLLVVCLWNVWSAWNDPTTSGVTDSETAMTYTAPKK